MSSAMTELFLEGLRENNAAKLLSVPKSDLHNHSTKGCRREWLAEKLQRRLAEPPERFCGLEGMQEWFNASIKPHCVDPDGTIIRWGCRKDQKHNRFFNKRFEA